MFFDKLSGMAERGLGQKTPFVKTETSKLGRNITDLSDKRIKQ